MGKQTMDSLWLVPLPDRSSEGVGAEDGIRDCLLSRGLGDVYKRQAFGGGLFFMAAQL